MGSSFQLVPVSLREAREFVLANHRHYRPPIGHKFSIGVAVGGKVCGVCIVGRPVSRHLDDGATLEVTRCCTRNACSWLYGRAWRAAQALGYRKLVTYTLEEEGGASLRGVGWRCLGRAGAGSWGREGRPRVDTHPTQTKIRWEATR